MHIAIISASVRVGRNSHRVALFFKRFIEENNLASVELLDLNAYQFPLFDERLRFQAKPSEKVLAFADKIKNADGVIMVTPEYNGGYPASIKNVIDLLYDEWYKKPIGLVTVSDGPFGGTQVMTSLQFSLWKIKAWVVPAMFAVPKVREAYDENGNAINKELSNKLAGIFMKEMLWCMEAKKRMEENPY
ncbi:NADPH-dependent FMN reductase [Solitalea koreensis]|uniref:NAD(P)H-dependent FMN reductase n=1 Tax=Solitalea koreensis TaxID=543615 RepID=A0A521B9Y3_9SPHI|nr:NAD(P)H-dependent oxidoreductase [Solitalea koreensis]SMO43898.1 NAD(P)H-dependent FMN reductase [Solitalea koreensis]